MDKKDIKKLITTIKQSSNFDLSDGSKCIVGQALKLKGIDTDIFRRIAHERIKKGKDTDIFRRMAHERIKDFATAYKLPLDFAYKIYDLNTLDWDSGKRGKELALDFLNKLVEKGDEFVQKNWQTLVTN